MATSLVKKNVQQELQIFNDGLTDDERLPPGHMRLFNFYRPSLQAEIYSITASQYVTVGSQSTDIFNAADQDSKPILPQTFSVVAPQFNLDPKIINSYYPPDGHQDQGNILPHIVFTDPHAPWYRPAGMSDWMNQNLDTDTTTPNPPTDRGNLVPWMALMVFKATDLHVPLADAQALALDQITAGKVASSATDGSIQPATTNVYNEQQQPANGAFKMTVGDYLSTIQSRVNYEAGFTKLQADWGLLKISTDTTSIIFPPLSMLTDVFGPSTSLQGLQAQKLQSHVRQLNTIGFPDAAVEGNGYYSVVTSMMTGDLTITAPSNHVVHLISIEHLDSTIPNIKSDATGRIGVVSLYSWTYQCIPEAVNFEILMSNLGTHSQPLRPPLEQLDPLQKQINVLTAKVVAKTATPEDRTSLQATSKLYERLQSGYTIARWRAPSGEESMAFNRGPLVPMLTPEVPTSDVKNAATAWPALSMHGRDYAVLDKPTGIFDATYAAAWSLGRLVAVSDSVFNAALMRFRSSIWNASTSALRKEANGVKDWAQIISDSVSAIADGGNMSSGSFVGTPTRVNKSANTPVAPAVDHLDMVGRLVDHIENNVTSTATCTVKDVNGNVQQSMYNGFEAKPAASSDWEVIYNWVYECLFLGHIPAHVLFPEPSHLKTKSPPPWTNGQTTFQQEALRFFYIDHAWLDCFIDGALSCANHVEPQYDNIRLKIKQIFNKVLSTPIGNLGRKPPVPRYGFVIRSAAVKATPDLKLTVRGWSRVGLKKMADGSFTKLTKGDTSTPDKFEWVADPDFDPLVRHTKLDDYTILSLVDCLPEQIAYVEMAQPAHQQRFALGVSVTLDDTTHLVNTITTEIDTIKLFTNKDRAPPNSETGTKPDPALLELPDMEWKALPPILSDTNFYTPKTRCINSIAIAGAFRDKLVDWGKINLCFDESDATHPTKGIPSSSMLGLQLNDRAYHFRINGTQPPAEKVSFLEWKRHLWTGPDTGTPAPRSPLPSDTTTPFVEITPPSNPTTAPPGIPPAPALNKIRAIPVSKSPVVGTTKIVNWASDANAQFELLIHPDYRPVAPKPAGPFLTFSPQDYLATETRYLYDLVFAVRRIGKGQADLNLRKLHIEIPVSLGSLASDTATVLVGNPPSPSPAGLKPREPLLKAGENAHSGVRMLYNARFVPSLYNGPASRIGDPRWDDQPVLGITLIPRSASTDGTVKVTNDGVAAMAIVLGEVQLNPVVREEVTSAYLVPPNPPAMTWKAARVPGATQVRIRMVEQYDGRPDRSSFCTVVKVRGPDNMFPDR